MTDATVGVVAHNCPGLERLDLNSTCCQANSNLHDESLVAIGQGCKVLRHLELADNPFITESGVQAVVSGCLELEFLNLARIGRSDDYLEHFENLEEHEGFVHQQSANDYAASAIAKCRRLQHLNIASFHWLETHGLEVICTSCPLIFLDISCIEIFAETEGGFETMTAIARNCPTLQAISLAQICAEDDEANGWIQLPSVFATNCQNLRYLNLQCNEWVTNRSLELLANTECTYLAHLVLDGCGNVTDPGIMAVAGGCYTNLKALEILDLESCSVDEAAIEALHQVGCIVKVSDDRFEDIEEDVEYGGRALRPGDWVKLAKGGDGRGCLVSGMHSASLSPFRTIENNYGLIAEHQSVGDQPVRVVTTDGQSYQYTASDVLRVSISDVADSATYNWSDLRCAVFQSLGHMHFSQSSDTFESASGDVEGGRGSDEQQDATTPIYGIICDYAASRQTTAVELSSVEPMVLEKGFTKAQLDVSFALPHFLFFLGLIPRALFLQVCLDSYAEINVWQVSTDNTKVEFV
jgi:hypothetical protein